MEKFYSQFVARFRSFQARSFFLIVRSFRRFTVEPRFNDVSRDYGNFFVKSRVCHIEHLQLTNFGKSTKMFVTSVLGISTDFFDSNVKTKTKIQNM